MPIARFLAVFMKLHDICISGIGLYRGDQFLRQGLGGVALVREDCDAERERSVLLLHSCCGYGFYRVLHQVALHPYRDRCEKKDVSWP